MSFFAKNIFTKAELASLASVIAEAESGTTGEIRVVIRHRRHYRERKLALHEIAYREFCGLGMQKTTDRTGVLILLLLSERAFHIIADEGIHRKVGEGTWDAVAASMSADFRDGKYTDGIAGAIRAVGKELATHFPGRGTNQLPDEIVER